jgi:hypothetical protein
MSGYSPALLLGIGRSAGNAAGFGGTSGTAIGFLKMSSKELAKPGACANRFAKVLFMLCFREDCLQEERATSSMLGLIKAPVGYVDIVGNFVFAHLCLVRAQHRRQ